MRSHSSVRPSVRSFPRVTVTPMSEMEILQAVGMALGTGVAAEIIRRVIPGTRHDSTAVRVLGIVSRVLTLGASSKIKGDGRPKR